MMNYIWSAIFLIAFLYSCLTGKLSLFADALTDSSTEAVQFVIGLAGVMA